MPVLIGTSGWQYSAWRGRFYPPGVPQRRWLEHYARHFRTVEVNNAFYRLPEPSTFTDWRSRTPGDFVVAVKASRYLSHVRRLREPAEPVARLLAHARHLGPKLGPILLQLPPDFRRDLGALEAVLEALPSGTRLAFEARHASWFEDSVAELLARHDAALCLSDTPERKTPIWWTATWGYLRFHQGRATPSPCYGRTALRSWAERLAEHWTAPDQCYVFFNNDTGGCAVRDARQFALAAQRVGLQPSRVPGPRDIRLTPAGGTPTGRRERAGIDER